MKNYQEIIWENYHGMNNLNYLVVSGRIQKVKF